MICTLFRFKVWPTGAKFMKIVYEFVMYETFIDNFNIHTNIG